MFYQTPVPRLKKGDRNFTEIVQRAAKLICTTPEFDELAQDVGLNSHKNGITDETQRAQLRAELDGIIAHLYGLTEEEFKYILTTFPIVPEEIKQAALEAYRTNLTHRWGGFCYDSPSLPGCGRLSAASYRIGITIRNYNGT